jgi:hypothetical protein
MGLSRTRATLLLGCGTALTLSACSFSIGGLDYDKLESEIAKELDSSYSSIDQKVSGVDCPEQSPSPKAGDTFQCKAEVGGQSVRVDVNVEDDDYENVNYETRDTLYDLPTVATVLGGEVSKEVGFTVTVDCGEGLQAVEVGATFDCTAADPQGVERTVQVTAAPVGEDDSWELLG